VRMRGVARGSTGRALEACMYRRHFQSNTSVNKFVRTKRTQARLRNEPKLVVALSGTSSLNQYAEGKKAGSAPKTQSADIATVEP
jgi:hypothetical protein